MGRGDGVNERLLENENNRLSDQLAGKISKLKQISIEMKVRSLRGIPYQKLRFFMKFILRIVVIRIIYAYDL